MKRLFQRGGGYIAGGQVTWSPGSHTTHWAVEGGLFSPQVGIDASYSWQIH